MILSNNTDTLTISLLDSSTTNQLRCYSNYTTSSGILLSKTFNTNDEEGVAIIQPPSVSNKPVSLVYLSVFNSDTVTATVLIKVNSNTINRFTLNSNEFLIYSNNDFQIKSASGLVKTETNTTVTNAINTLVLGSDVINNNVTANTIQDVNNLGFPVLEGNLYWFKFSIIYTSAATTTGSRWSINGGAFTYLNYISEYTLTSATSTRNVLQAYDLPATSNAGSGSTSNNMAIIEGVIKASSSFDLKARFASEITNSAITAKAGSFVEYKKIY